MSYLNGTLLKVSVVYYQTTRGDFPARDYIESLPEKEKAKVKALIDHLSEQVVLHFPQARKMTGYLGLYELRPGPYRIFYCYHGDKIVLLHAFRKKSGKTPQREIERAIKRMNS